MCGIVAYVSRDKKTPLSTQTLIKTLQRLDYRGYDSFGYITDQGDFYKSTLPIHEALKILKNQFFTFGISHTRWATHGEVNSVNAHPHVSFDKKFALVHNGIIENAQDLKKNLIKKHPDFIFQSQTDSEIFLYYLYDLYRQGLSLKERIQKIFLEIQGIYSVVLLELDTNNLYAFKKDAPLVLGIDKQSFILSSDPYAFIETTQQAIFLDDFECIHISEENYIFYNKAGDPITKHVSVLSKPFPEAESNISYPHIMLKEIHEQPLACKRLLENLACEQYDTLKKFSNSLKNFKKIVFIACGTSYHASLYATFHMNALGIETTSLIASEYRYYNYFSPETLCIALSQSGETMDVLKAMKYAKNKGATLYTIINTPFSSIQRLSSLSLNIFAGQEIAVASTKAFTNLLVLLQAIINTLQNDSLDVLSTPSFLEDTLTTVSPQAQKVSKLLTLQEHIFLIARGYLFPIALEIALKIKEVSYIHAEAFSSGELKHGSIALIDKKKHTPFIPIYFQNDTLSYNSVEEILSRGAKIFAISCAKESTFQAAQNLSPLHQALYATITGQLLSYYIALERNCSIDKPRNLAKSVTVE